MFTPRFASLLGGSLDYLPYVLPIFLAELEATRRHSYLHRHGFGNVRVLGAGALVGNLHIEYCIKIYKIL